MSEFLKLSADDKPLSKSAIYKLISDNANISVPVIKEIFEDFQNLMYAELDRIGEFRVLDMGKVKVVFSPEREGINPMSGEKILIPSKTKLKFRFSKQLKDFANSLYV